MKTLLVFFCLLHLLGALGFVSFFEWGSKRPLLTDDYAFRSALMEETRALFDSSGRLWGYSPFHSAGYPHALFGISTKGEQILSLLFPLVNPAELLKGYLLVGILITPFLILMTGKMLKMPPPAIATAGMIAILFFWQHPNLSSLQWGSVSFLLSCLFTLLSLAALFRFLEKPRLGMLLLFGIGGAMALCIHSVALIVLFPPALTALIMGLRQRPKSVLLLGFAGLLSIVALNLFWILPMVRHSALLDISLTEAPFRENPSIVSWYFRKDLSRLLLLLLGLLGLRRWSRTAPTLAFPFTTAVFLLLALIFFLKYPASLTLQSSRYLWPLILFLLFPASSFLTEKSGKIPRFLLWGIVLLALVTADKSRFLSCFSRLFSQKTSAASEPLPTSIRPPEMDRLVAWISRYPKEAGRLLLEESRHPRHRYWESHLPAILPLWAGRELVNPPMPDTPLKLSSITLMQGTLFGKNVESFSPEAFEAYLNRYNIRWIAAFYPMTKRYLDSLPAELLKKEEEIAHLACYRVNRPSNYFLKGSGKVEAGFNRIALRQVRSESGEIVLKYHWFPGLVTIPERPIGKEEVENDPAGFIKIENPPETLEIRL